MSSNKRLTSYYFDSCVYLAHLRNEETYGKPRLKAIDAIWRQSERGGVAVVTSSITITEVLAHHLTAKAKKRFMQAIESGIHQCEDPTPPICIKASDYRVFYQHHPVQNPFGEGNRSDLTATDAIHLATASILNVDYFFTFDGIAKKKTVGLLWLKNKVAADNLIICQPETDQGEFSNF
jgi:predicted nucleic acid-binding protein